MSAPWSWAGPAAGWRRHRAGLGGGSGRGERRLAGGFARRVPAGNARAGVLAFALPPGFDNLLDFAFGLAQHGLVNAILLGQRLPDITRCFQNERSCVYSWSTAGTRMYCSASAS